MRDALPLPGAPVHEEPVGPLRVGEVQGEADVVLSPVGQVEAQGDGGGSFGHLLDVEGMPACHGVDGDGGTCLSFNQQLSIFARHHVRRCAGTDAEEGVGGVSVTGGGKAGRMIIATVKGDVHDIGKNIVSVVMRCNGFEVTDLGVMVPGEEIVKAAIEHNADIVALSGLITPSLDEMCRVARLMEERGLDIPLMVGGATTSELHTAVKIAPEYHGAVVHTRDAAAMPVVASRLLAADHDDYISLLKAKQAKLKSEYESAKDLIPLSEARNRRLKLDFAPTKPATMGITDISITVGEAARLINWKPFFKAWHLIGKDSRNEAAKLQHDAVEAIQYLKHNANNSIKARIGLWNAFAEGDDIIIDNNS